MESNKAIRFGLLVCLVIAVFTFLNISDVICQQTYNVKEATLTYSPTTTTTYNARDKIVFGTGFRFDSSVGGKRFVGSIDEKLIFGCDYSATAVKLPSNGGSGDINYNLPFGKVGGELNISQAGAAVYNIPINVSPGTAGMEPSISLVYNSQSGNGIAGYGWSLSCASAVSRCGQTVYHDGKVGGVSLTNEDRLSLDGQRLMLISGDYGANGSIYRFENDNGSKISAYGNIAGGAEKYVVETKDGRKISYDYRLVLSSGSQPFLYLVSKIEDLNGNYINYQYITDNSTKEVLINRILYTGSKDFEPYNSVEFYYDKREDKRVVYAVGTKIEQNHLLRGIGVKSEGQHVCGYELKYVYDVHNSKSKLNEVYYKDVNGIRLNPMVINYGERNSDYQILTQTGVQNYYDENGIRHSFHYKHLSDFNNDGISDLLCVYNCNNPYSGDLQHTGSKFRIYLGDGSGNYSVDAQGAAWYEHYYGNGDPTSDYPHGAIISKGGTNVMIRDMNGDGWEDVFCYKLIEAKNRDNTVDKSADIKYEIGVFLRVPNGNGVKFQYYELTDDKLTIFAKPYNRIYDIHVADLNGDGLLDIVYTVNSSENGKSIVTDVEALIVKEYMSTPSKTIRYARLSVVNEVYTHVPKITLVDFNRNGKSNILMSCEGSDIRTNIFEYDSYNNTEYITRIEQLDYPTVNHDCYFGDFNGDGYVDILTWKDNRWDIRLNNGNVSWNKCYGNKDYLCPITSTADPEADDRNYNYYAVDINGDGMCDILELQYIDSDRSVLLRMHISTGVGFTTREGLFETNIRALSSDSSTSFGFLNKDSFVDMLFGSNYYAANQTIISFSPGKDEHLIKSIMDIDRIDITYKSILDKMDVLKEHADNGDRLFNKVVPSDVVDRMIVKCNSNVMQNNYYTYQEPVFHSEGKGFLGYRKSSVFNQQTYVTVMTNMSVNRSVYIPIVTSVEKSISGVKISSQLLYYNFYMSYVENSKIFVNHNYKTDNFDYSSGILEQEWVESYDDWYNPTKSHIKRFRIDGGGQDYVETIIVDKYVNGGAWIPHLPQEITIIKTRTGESVKGSRKLFEYDMSGNITKESNFYAMTGITDLDNVIKYNNYQHGVYSQMVVSNAKDGIRTNSRVYDSKSRFILTIINNLGYKQYFEYDGRSGNILSNTDENDIRTDYSYDGLWNLQETRSQRGNVTHYEEGWCVGLNGSDAPQPPENVYTYKREWTDGGSDIYSFADVRGNQIRVATRQPIIASSKWLYNDIEYDHINRVLKEYLPYVDGLGDGRHSKYYYYNFTNGVNINKLRQVLRPDGTSTNYTYNGFETVISNVSGAKSEEKYQRSDAMGKVVEVRDDGGTISYKYDSDGNVKIIQHQDAAIVLEYDAVGNRTLLSDPSAGRIASKYNAWGELVAQESAQQRYEGRYYKMTYDGLGRLTSKCLMKGLFSSLSGNEVERHSYTYGTSNNVLGLAQETSKNASRVYKYDINGRLIKNSERIFGADGNTERTFEFGYEYDVYGRLTAEIYPEDVRIENKYDEYGYLYYISLNGTKTLYRPTSYNERGVINGYKLGSSINVAKSFDSDSRLIGIRSTVGSNTVQHLRYDYLPDGNMSYRSDELFGVKEWFSYDVLNRLTGCGVTSTNVSSCSITPSITYSGNKIKSKVGIGNYVYDSHIVNALSDIRQGDNKLINPNDCSIAYTPFNKIETIIEGNNCILYTYGVDNNLVKSSKVNGVSRIDKYYGLGGAYEEKLEGGQKTSYYYVNGDDGLVAIIEKRVADAAQISFILKDHLGSVAGVLNSNGAVLGRYSYDAWGRRRNANNWNSYDGIGLLKIDRGFCGHEHLDGLNLINMTGRVYDPILGMFLSPDPYVQLSDNTQGLNRYSYCFNNPLMYVDPSGEIVITTGVLITAAVIGGIINYGIQCSQGNVNSLGDFLLSFGIGAVVGIGGAIAFPVALSGMAAYGISGFAGWALSGMLSSAVTSPVLSWGNHIAFDTPVMTWKELGMTIGISGVMSGIMGGIQAVSEGRRFLLGDVKPLPNPVRPSLPSQINEMPAPQTNTNASQAAETEILQSRAAATSREASSVTSYYPPNDGFLDEVQTTYLMKGDVVDRFGGVSEGSVFISPESIPVEMRSLPHNSCLDLYDKFKVMKPFPVQSGKIAPWFGKPGMGIQFQTSVPIKILLDKGIIIKF